MGVCSCGEAHEPRALYFVSVRDDAGRNGLACGPYLTHQAALDDVKRVRDHAYRLDPTTWWLAWGTCGTDDHRRQAKWLPSEIPR